jgi:hypothetical protein
MGRFTLLDDPLVDQTIEAHLHCIVAAVRSRMEPQAIILRGSFGRGEGSVAVQDGQLRFLSDYEIDVATFSPLYRSLFRELSHQLTAEFGVETGLRWVRPDYMSKNRVGPLPMGPAPITISLYESRYGSRMLYGQDVISSGPAVDPCQIRLESAIRLVLNRMAESLYYMPTGSDITHDELEVFYWVNKTILACAESLLLLWGQYHFSYQERGRRFATMADDRLVFMNDQGAVLSDLVTRATEFKLQPRRSLYPDTDQETWLQVVPICGTVFQHLVERVLGLSFDAYAEFPERYLQNASAASRSLSPLHFVTLKSLDVYKYLRRRRLPRGLPLPYGVPKVVYAVVPLVFMGWASNNETLPTLLSEVRRWLGMICPLQSPQTDPRQEWDALRQSMLWAWKNFCYL